MDGEITLEQVHAATERFLAGGGRIEMLPDTVDEQRHVMRLEEKLEGADGLAL